MIVLHHGWKSSASRRVRLLQEEKGLAYESRVVDVAAMEHHDPAYLRINPNGVVPTLVHDGRPLHESGTICEYLDECSPDPPLRPEPPYDRALMRNWIRHIDERIGHLIALHWRHRLRAAVAALSDVEPAERIGRIPSKERQEARRHVARRPFTGAERGEARDALVALLDRMEAALERGGWLAGAGYSVADIAAVPFAKRIEEEIAPDQMTEAAHPRVADWWARVQARPACTRAGIGLFLDAPAGAA